jgi:hypothetical protein
VPDGWKVSDAIVWRRITLYRAGDHRGPETRKILRLALDAKERAFDAVIFSRDRDHGRDAQDRHRDIRAGLDAVKQVVPESPPIAGGVAVPCLEGWVAASLGVQRTEEMSNPAAKQALGQRGVPCTTQGMVDAIERSPTDRCARDAVCLIEWLTSVRVVLGG